MEKLEKFECLDLNLIKEECFKMLSPYFNNIFSSYFTKVSILRKNNQDGILVFELIIDEKCANPLQIVHGGALATLIENLSSVSLFYLCKMRYRTLDISINYKNQVPLDKPMLVVVNCQKVGSNTSFVEVEVKDELENICTQASLIKSKIGVKTQKQLNKNKTSSQKNNLQNSEQVKKGTKLFKNYFENNPNFSNHLNPKF